MAKLRKMLGRADDPGIVALMRQMDTQSAITLARWSIRYALENYLPVCEELLPGEGRPRAGLEAAAGQLAGELKPAAAKDAINAAASAARETSDPVAQAAARAVAVAAASVRTPTNALGMAFYGAAALAYRERGCDLSSQEYDALATEEFARMLESLKAASVANEPNSAKLNWNC